MRLADRARRRRRTRGSTTIDTLFTAPSSVPARLAAVATTLLVLLLAASVAPAPAAAAADPVVRSISIARASGHLTREEARGLRASWLFSGEAARTAPTSLRRANVLAVRAYTRNLALAGGLRADRLRPALLSVKATTWAMGSSARPFPAHESTMTIPGEPVVFKYYVGRGVQFQPFESFKRGMALLNQPEPDVEAARELADRMVELSNTRSGATNWEFFFAFGGPARPWTSAISQAEGLWFFQRLAALLPEGERATYEAASAGMVRSLLRPTSRGGLASAQGSGRFYVMYSFHPSQRILNGHLEVLLDVHRYWRATGSPQALRVYRLGRAAVLPMMPSFDTGDWSNYQPGQLAELGYHEFQTRQLVLIARETKDAALRAYAVRFTRYLEDPPVVSIPTPAWKPIIPAPDGFRDSISVRFRTDKRGWATLVVSDSRGREVRRVERFVLRGSRSVSWDGRDARGRVVADGDYGASLVVKDLAGNRATQELPAPLRVERDVQAPELQALSVRRTSTGATVYVRATDAGSAQLRVELRIGGRLVASRSAPPGRGLLLRTTRSVTQVRRGAIIVRDASGNVTLRPVAAANAGDMA